MHHITNNSSEQLWAKAVVDSNGAIYISIWWTFTWWSKRAYIKLPWDMWHVKNQWRVSGGNQIELFLFSLNDKAKTWFNLLPKNTIVTWDEMANNFLTMYFPHQKCQNSKMISLPFLNLNLKVLMKLGKRIRAWLGKSHIIDFLLGWRFNSFITNWL